MVGVDVETDDVETFRAAHTGADTAERFCQYYRSAAVDDAHVLLRAVIHRHGGLDVVIADLGDDEADVLTQLAVIVEDWVEIFLRDGRPLPAPSAGKTYSGKFLVRVSPEIHQKASLKAQALGESLNQFVAEAIASA